MKSDIELSWPGDPVEHMPSAAALLEALPPNPMTHEERSKIMAFYSGEQWDPQVLKSRIAAGRPTLTINRLPLLVAAATEYPGMESGPFTDLIVAITLRNMDAQRLYNYMASVMIERESCRPAKILNPDDLGKSAYQSQWAGIRNPPKWEEFAEYERKRYIDSAMAAVQFYLKAEDAPTGWGKPDV